MLDIFLIDVIVSLEQDFTPMPEEFAWVEADKRSKFNEVTLPVCAFQH